MRIGRGDLIALTLLGALTVGGGAACRLESRFLDPDSRLDRSLFYTERDLSNGSHPISAESAEGAVERVPYPTGVDINSAIQIRIAKDGLTIPGASRSNTMLLEAGDLKADIHEARQLIELIEEFVEERIDRVQRAEDLLEVSAAARSSEPLRIELDAAIADITSFEERVLDRVDALWPEGTPAGDRADAFLGADFPGQDALRALSQSAETQVVVLEERMRAVERDLERRRSKLALRLEAFLETDGAQPTPIHLPGYDLLPEGRLQVRDRWGLDLSDEELARYRDLAQASRELSDAANRLRRGEATLREAFARMSSRAGARLGELVLRADALLEELERTALRKRAEDLADALDGFWDGRIEALRDMREDKARALETLLDNLRQRLSSADAAIEAIELLRDLKSLERMLTTLRPEDIPEVVLRANRLVGSAQQLLSTLLAGDALGGVIAELERSLLELERLALEDLDLGALFLEPWKASEARREIIELAALLDELRSLVDSARQIVFGVSQAPPTEFPRVPEALDVDLDLAGDTLLDLMQTARMDGDRVTVRATLIEDGREVETSRATFVVERFGWHARLHPSVAIVEAEELSGGDESGGFAPVVNWMHRYHPRASEDGTWAGIARALQPSGGLHAAFLNYDQDNNPEIGLGLTFALWDDRLQLGVGYNLLADGRDDGQYYYFIGSSLIPLLQGLTGSSESGGGRR